VNNAFFKYLNKCVDAPCYATERDHFKILKHTACNECVLSVDGRLSLSFSIFPFLITILKAKLPDFVRGGLRPLALGWLWPCTRPLKLSDNGKSYYKQLSNLVEVTPFYGIGLNSKLGGFSAH